MFEFCSVFRAYIDFCHVNDTEPKVEVVACSMFIAHLLNQDKH